MSCPSSEWLATPAGHPSSPWLLECRAGRPLVAVDGEIACRLVEGECACGQPEDQRRVGSQDGIEALAFPVMVHLDAGRRGSMTEGGERLGARPGSMFGHPALYAGRRLAVCAFGAGLGLRLSAERVSELIATGRGTPFQPYGKSPMREWVHVSASASDDGNAMATLIAEALEFAGGHAPS